MSSGGGGKSVVDDVINVATNTVTLGTIGYEGDGRFGQGILTNAGDELVGEVTGRNASRDALYEQRRTLDAEVARRQQEMRDQLTRRGQDDLAASNAAGAVRFGSNMSNGSNGSSAPRDFLGL